jgi:flagellar protein FlgJ
MLDQQISQNLAKRGVGLADVLVRQLSANGGMQALQGQGLGKGAPGAAAAPMPNPVGVASDPAKVNSSQPAHIKAFQDRLGAHAEEASLTTGIPAKFMLGQAALESGWGKHEIPAADGSASHNLFGIKATGGWKGKVVEAPTSEFLNGVMQTKLEKFRVYDSYADGFRDYAKLLRSNPRYENVLANAKDAVGFAQGLQRAGYATDPNYAAKLARIIQQSLSA